MLQDKISKEITKSNESSARLSKPTFQKINVQKPQKLLSKVITILCRINQDIFTVVPLTFHITKGSEDPEFDTFCQHF